MESDKTKEITGKAGDKDNGKKAPVIEMPTPKQASELDVRTWELQSCRMELLFMEQETVKLRRENSVLKKTIAELNCQLEAHQFDRMQGAINDKVEQVNPRYQEITKKIAADCGIKDPKKMSIDTDTFVVKEIG
jgi:virulence-associated protein VapD